MQLIKPSLGQIKTTIPVRGVAGDGPPRAPLPCPKLCPSALRSASVRTLQPHTHTRTAGAARNHCRSRLHPPGTARRLSAADDDRRPTERLRQTAGELRPLRLRLLGLVQDLERAGRLLAALGAALRLPLLLRRLAATGQKGTLTMTAAEAEERRKRTVNCDDTIWVLRRHSY